MSLPFHFRGEVPASKSLLIRALLLRSFDPELRIDGVSGCDDVRAMESAILALGSGMTSRIDCGEAGLVLRLLVARLSRVPGSHLLRGSPRLLARPHDPLFETLSRLGVEVTREGGREPLLRVRSEGWRDPGGPVPVDRAVSSQFASALLLSSWELDFPLVLRERGEEVSAGYFDLSVTMAREAGMRLERGPSGIKIPARQKIEAKSLRAEADLSSAFAVAALAAVAGEAEILNAGHASAQPDAAFVDWIAKMGVPVRRDGGILRVDRAERLLPVEGELGSSPDLFPVLAVLCALADGRSELRGAPHLRHKESDRLGKTAELLEKLGRRVEPLADGLVIHGRGAGSGKPERAEFSPERDHRLVMAGAVAIAAGLPLHLRDTEVVSKSFPEFLEIAGLAVRP